MLTLRDLQHLRRFVVAARDGNLTAQRHLQWAYDLGPAVRASERVRETMCRYGIWVADYCAEETASDSPRPHFVLFPLLPMAVELGIDIVGQPETDTMLDALDRMIAAHLREAA